jgi:hypothetical protein
MRENLRVYPAQNSEEAKQQAPSVHVSLGDLLPLVAMAQQNNSVWLQDFLDDEVCITTDLYEVLRAFHYYRPSA